MKTIIRTTAASLALVLGACGDDTTPGADTITGTGTGTGDDGVDDGIPTTTAPTTLTTMGMEDSSTGGPSDDTVGPIDSSDDGPPADSSSSDGGPADSSSSSEGGGESSSSSEGGEESSSSDGGMMNCGNGAIDAPEDCDGAALGGANCISIGMGFDGGTLACAADCTFDTSACTGGKGGASCAGFCGSPDPVPGSSPECFCDDICMGQGDCCADVCDPGICDGDPAICGGGMVPAEWTCNPDYYDEDAPNEICDCSCGAHDPDCDVPGVSLWCEGTAPAPAGTTCVDDVCVDDGGGVPAEWTCNPIYYDALDGCDCSCGAHDPDCDVAGQTLYCDEALAAPGTVCENDVCVDGGGGGFTCIDVSGCVDGDEPSCTCEACDAGGGCTVSEDCVCPDCAADAFCGNAANCNSDGVCDPYNEGCVCADCADHPLCP